jgi:putative phosphoribosyl transferase
MQRRPFMFVGYQTRSEAGRKLGKALAALHIPGDVIVLGLPRGGVPVANEVALSLHAPLDVLVVRKIGAPHNPELACGAVASGGITVWNRDLLHQLALLEKDFEATLQQERGIVRKRESEIRGSFAPPPVLNRKTVVLVDDGLATGASMRAAIQAVKAQSPRQIIVAVPVAPKDTVQEIEDEEHLRVECLQKIASGRFSSVGQWYEDFTQVETAECRDILSRFDISSPPLASSF